VGGVCPELAASAVERGLKHSILLQHRILMSSGVILLGKKRVYPSLVVTVFRKIVVAVAILA